MTAAKPADPVKSEEPAVAPAEESKATAKKQKAMDAARTARKPQGIVTQTVERLDAGTAASIKKAQKRHPGFDGTATSLQRPQPKK